MCGAIFLPQQRQSDALVQHGICGQQGRYQSGEADQEGLRRSLPFGDRDQSGDRRRSDCPRGISTAPRTCAPSIRPYAASRRYRSRTVRNRCASARPLPLGYRRLGQHEVQRLSLRRRSRCPRKRVLQPCGFTIPLASFRHGIDRSGRCNEPARAHHRVIRPRPHRRIRPPCFLSLPRILHRNAHTRRAYARAATEFFDWLAGKGVTLLAGIESIHVAAYIEELSRARSVPTAKLRLAAPRHLFDWLVIGRILPANPAAAVRGPLHIVPTKSVPIAFRDMSYRPPKPTAAPVESRIRLNSTLSERIRACFA